MIALDYGRSSGYIRARPAIISLALPFIKTPREPLISCKLKIKVQTHEVQGSTTWTLLWQGSIISCLFFKVQQPVLKINLNIAIQRQKRFKTHFSTRADIHVQSLTFLKIDICETCSVFSVIYICMLMTYSDFGVFAWCRRSLIHLISCQMEIPWLGPQYWWACAAYVVSNDFLMPLETVDNEDDIREVEGRLIHVLLISVKHI